MAACFPAMLDAFAKTSPEPTTTAPDHESDPQRSAPPSLVGVHLPIVRPVTGGPWHRRL
jgi:hypothetical protein